MPGRQGPPPGYVEVSDRWAKARADYPDARLRPANLERPFELVQVGEQWFIVYTAAAYRSADDLCPGIGVAWEPVPGKTPYTKDSELMNAETSAWGRALVAAGMADAREGIASANEVRARESVEAPAAVPSAQVGRGGPPPTLPPARGDLVSFRARVRELAGRTGWDADDLRHLIVRNATNGRTESSAEVSKAELPACWEQYRRAVLELEGGEAVEGRG